MKKNEISGEWQQQREMISNEADHLDMLLHKNNPPSIYGANTLVGHLDSVTITDEDIASFQTDLLDNHSIGGEASYNDDEIKCITYAKLQQLSRGGSGITLDLYDYLMDNVSKQSFPYHVPKTSSYSAGDVIPAAHWAKEITSILAEQHDYKMQRKEALSLINGSFIHAGIALSKVKKLQSIWSLYNFNSIKYGELLDDRPCMTDMLSGKEDTMKYPIKWLEEADINNENHDIQYPVSIRAYPQVSSALLNSVVSFIESVEEQLQRQSDNPLISTNSDIPASQGSFLAPMMTLSTSQLIEALLLAMWQTERRIHFLLSGNIKDVPLNARKGNKDLGFIQVPKLVSAKLEDARLTSGRRTFASGGSTSYGIEDLWSNGLITLDHLEYILESFNTILAIEYELLQFINDNFLKGSNFKAQEEKFKDEGQLRERYLDTINKNNYQTLPIDYHLFPFDEE